MTGERAAQAQAHSRRPFYMTIAMIALGQFVAFINATVLTTALPVIRTSLEMTPVEASWIFTATILLNTVGSPIWGRLADRYSPIVLIRVSMVMLAVGALVGALAPTGAVLVLGRAIQGVGYGGVFSLGIVVLANIVPPRERGKFFGFLSALQLLGQLAGPLLGGLLVDSPLGWRACLYLGIPPLVIALIVSYFGLSLTKEDVSKERIDWPGAILLALGVSAVLIWISFVGDTFEIGSAISLALIIGGVLVLVAAIVIELRAKSPLLPLRVMRSRIPLIAAVASLVTGAATMPLGTFMSYYFQIGREIPATQSGLLLIAIAVGSVAAASAVGGLSGRSGRLRRYLVTGAIILLVGALMLVFVGPDTNVWIILVPLLLFGIGQGATAQYYTLAAQNAVGLKDVGSVTGFMSFTQLLGSSIGLSIFTSVANSRINALEAGGMSEAEAYANGIPTVFLLIAGVSVLVLIAVLLLPSIRLRKTVDIEPVDRIDEN